MKKREYLYKVKINSKLFDNILYFIGANNCEISIVDNVMNHIDDTSSTTYYDGKCMIVLEFFISRFCKEYQPHSRTQTYKIMVERSDEIKNIEQTISGNMALSYANKQLTKYYSEEEISECLNNHTKDYNANKIQYHYNISSDIDCSRNVMKFSNCYHYDINGAHNDALIEIFPKARKWLENVYLKRKTKPILKDYINYYVGILCCIGHRKTYNWIVQRTTDILNKAIEEVGGTLIYANTDGFIVSNPTRQLETQENVLGKFKLEYKGDVYVYQSKNYCLIQTNKMKGNCLNSVRDRIDLSKGIVVDYDIQEKYHIKEATNIKVINKEVEEWED